MTRPSSIPHGLHVELSRARILSGKRGMCDQWMQMLNDRIDECTDTLSAERMALEVVFRRTDEDGEWIYWLSIFGDGGAEMDGTVAIDRDHLEFSRSCKEPGWQDAEPAFLLATESVREAILAATLTDR